MNKELIQKTIDKITFNLKDKISGNLTVIKCAGRYKNKPEYMLLCECKCGFIKKIRKSHFLDGSTKSCGCLKKGRSSLTSGEAAFNAFYGSYKLSAKKRKIKWNLTKEFFKDIIFKNCHYCNIPPTELYGRMYENFNGSIIVNGIDRKNNNKGYSIDNSLPCCKVCNRAKNTLLYEDFNIWIKRLKVYGKIT